jgi:hypothetical protein
MQRIMAIAIVMLAMTAVARADSLVSVDMLPVTSRGETVEVNFIWDTTTNVLSDLHVTSSPLWGPLTLQNVQFGFNDTGSHFGLALLDFTSPGGEFALDGSFDNFNPIGSAPGTYTTELFFQCVPATCPPGAIGFDLKIGSAIVTPFNPVATPEPGTLTLLGVGLASLAIRKYKRPPLNP